MNRYTAEEIAEILQREGMEDINVRTVRYYTQIEMLTNLEKGKAKYTDEHVKQLMAIKAMKKTGEELGNIRAVLNSMPSEKVSRIADQALSYSSAMLVKMETHKLSEDVSVVLSEKLDEKLKTEIVETVSKIIRGKKNVKSAIGKKQNGK